MSSQSIQSLFLSPNVPVWLTNLAAHPDGGRWLLADPSRFASFYAALLHRIELPQTMRAALPKSRDRGEIRSHIKNVEFEAWRKSDDRPFHGRVSSAVLEAFWEGSLVAGWAQRQPQAWQQALTELCRTARLPATGNNNDTDSTDHTGSSYMNTNLSVAAREAADRAGATQGFLSALDQPLTSSSEATDQAASTLFRMNMMILSAAHPFTALEFQLVEFAFVLAEDEAVRLFFELVAQNPRTQNSLMAAAFDISVQEWEALVSPEGRMERIHMVPFDTASRRVLPIHAFWHEWLGSLHKTASDAVYRLVRPLVRPRNAGAIGRLSPEDTGIVERILLSGAYRHGTNVLLYGPGSIDKIGWVHERLRKLNLNGWELPPTVPDQVRASVCYLAQRILERLDDKAVLVLSQADTILTRSQRGMHQFLFISIEMDDECSDSVTEEALLLDNPVPTIWLVNHTDRLSENNIGRFLYACEIKTASRAERRVEIASMLSTLDVSEAFVTELSQHLRLSEGQLKSAVELVQRLSADAFQRANQTPGQTPTQAPGRILDQDRANREDMVRRAIEQSQKALNRRQREQLRIPDTQYSLDFLNTAGIFRVPQVIAALKRDPNASLCFYGIPGTGKTQLAEHIAVELDKPILIKRASDILDKYVGQNEKNIKHMFEEARDEDAVLLLDEADSFLRDRHLASRSWEVSTVNELLQSMERHRGVFICATNLFRRLDSASLRRFTFKLEFLPLTPEQKWRMLVIESGLIEADMTTEQKEQWQDHLLFMANLTPGDFATVKRQARLLGVSLSPETWLKALETESRAKMDEVATLSTDRDIH